MTWEEFRNACHELAALGEERFRTREVLLLGTLRRNGWPRISPVEMDFVDGELLVGMMPRSPKALDLLRDPRYVAHSAVSTRHGTEGDFKLYGEALPVDDPGRRAAYRAAIKARIGWGPGEPDYPLFALGVQSAGFVVFGQDAFGMAWEAERGLRR